MSRLLCFFGLHTWLSSNTSKQTCRDCGTMQDKPKPPTNWSGQPLR